ncbi:hypothetical protein HGRIS_006423 [Hohenbuehelia grisea]
MIHKSRQPDPSFRGRLFENALTRLAEWWSGTYFEVDPEGHLRNRTFEDVQKGLIAEGLITPTTVPPSPSPAKGKNKHKTEARKLVVHPVPLSEEIDIEKLQDVLDDDGETIRSPKSLMKHALMRSGSRDTSAQLFTALCRSLNLPARLVVSIQSVPWQVGIDKPKPKYDRKKGKGKTQEVADQSSLSAANSGPASGSASEVDVKGKGKAKETDFAGVGQRLDGTPVRSARAKGKEKAKPVIKLRKTKDAGRVLGRASPSIRPSSLTPEPPDPTTTPPVFWTEVFSRSDGRWLPVDPIRGIVNKRKSFDPTPTSVQPAPPPPNPNSLFPHTTTKKPQRLPASRKQDNRLLYVLAFEEDGYARDVTRRYAKEFGAKVAKAQGQGARGKSRIEWWESLVALVHRPFRLNRDDVEDDELVTNQLMEAMPTTIAGFKDHPLYVLLRHLHQNQAILPPPPETPELGTFRGEPVYPRSAVADLKTSENWMRSEGRVVRAGAQAVKMVKVRAGTVGRMRELESLKEAGSGTGDGAEPMQGLYSLNQTEDYVPDPVVDGVVPKNKFGNIDLYVPFMLPRGAVHVPFKGTAKIARKLGIDFAEAVTGFEFRNRRANPVIEGVVVAVENEAVLLNAYWEAEQEAAEKARSQLEERVIKRWTRLVHGLRIRQRLKAQYQTEGREEGGPSQLAVPVDGEKADGPGDSSEITHGGGFLVEADDVVQAFHLPRNLHSVLPSTTIYPPPKPAEADGAHTAVNDNATVDDAEAERYDRLMFDTHTMDVDDEEAVDASASGLSLPKLVPKTMAELAQDAVVDGVSHDLAGADELEAIDNDEPQGGVVGSNGDAQDPDTSALKGSTSMAGVDMAESSNSSRRVTRASRRGNAPSQSPEKASTSRSSTIPAKRAPRNAKKPPASRRRPARKRRRAEPDEEAVESEPEMGTSDIDFDADLLQEDADDDVEQEAQGTPRKRALASRPSPVKRGRRSAAGTGAPIVKRELRPRAAKAKTQAHQEREREMDEAFERAIAE